MDDDLQGFVKEYFKRGFTYKEILNLLESRNGLHISLRQLSRILRNNGLYRKRHQTESREVIIFISNLIKDSSYSTLGYRQLHQHCIRNELRVSRETVRKIVQHLDPEGVENRRRHRMHRRLYHSLGPNWSWHIDGYDKLKPYGIPIHGAIDGFSRKILWLEICGSNKDPRVVCHFFARYIQSLNGVPIKVVADRGTENVNIAAFQRFLRRNHGDSMAAFDKCFKYGKSITNQRIEALWSQLRKSCTGWWMDFFKGLIVEDLLDTTNDTHIDCIQFVFRSIIQADLNNDGRCCS